MEGVSILPADSHWINVRSLAKKVLGSTRVAVLSMIRTLPPCLRPGLVLGVVILAPPRGEGEMAAGEADELVALHGAVFTGVVREAEAANGTGD